MDPQTHKRYLDYRARFEYFGRNVAILTALEYAPLDAELRELQAKGDACDDEEEARLAELLSILLMD